MVTMTVALMGSKYPGETGLCGAKADRRGTDVPPAWYTPSMTRFRPGPDLPVHFCRRWRCALPGLDSFLTPDENLWSNAHPRFDSAERK